MKKQAPKNHNFLTSMIQQVLHGESTSTPRLQAFRQSCLRRMASRSSSREESEGEFRKNA